jgi:uncharacterized protein (TIGR03435 family)
MIRMLRLSFIAASLVLLAPALGQMPSPSESANSAKPFAYDVVSIRPHPNGDGSSIQPAKDGLRIVNISLRNLIVVAYQVRWDCISGGPEWAESDRYDLSAKMDDETAAALETLPLKEQNEKRAKMLVAVLSERFHLKVRMVKKEMPTYQLVPAKNGPKLKAVDGNGQYENGIQGANHKPLGPGALTVSSGKLLAQAIDMRMFAGNLAGIVERPVVDKTELTGKYDILLRWTPEGVATGDDNFGDIFSALQEQLGLKLESTRELVDAIVIESVERPTAN